MINKISRKFDIGIIISLCVYPCFSRTNLILLRLFQSVWKLWYLLLIFASHYLHRAVTQYWQFRDSWMAPCTVNEYRFQFSYLCSFLLKEKLTSTLFHIILETIKISFSIYYMLLFVYDNVENLLNYIIHALWFYSERRVHYGVQSRWRCQYFEKCRWHSSSNGQTLSSSQAISPKKRYCNIINYCKNNCDILTSLRWYFDAY